MKFLVIDDGPRARFVRVGTPIQRIVAHHDVFGLQVAVVDAPQSTELHCVNQLEHAVFHHKLLAVVARQEDVVVDDVAKQVALSKVVHQSDHSKTL